MKIAERTVVTIDYTLTVEGEVIDSSKGEEPLTYLQGGGQIVPGLEQALEGKEVGDTISVTVSPEDGYGERDDALVQTVPRSRFPMEDLQTGMAFQAESQDMAHLIRVVSVDGDEVKVDANHPLAGNTLEFAVTVMEVRQATLEELTHGHSHGPEGHDHDH